MEGKNVFSKREWIFVLIIISLFQGIVWYVSFLNANRGSALNYVSFAGTIISIILAVLAIGYTYGESLGQKNKSDNIASQIAALNEVIKSIKLESKSLEHISVISNELSLLAAKFDEGITSTQAKVTDVSKSLNVLLNEYDKYKEKDTVIITQSKLDKSEAAKSIMAARMPLMEISLLAIANTDGKQMPGRVVEMINENVIKYVERAKNVCTDKNHISDGVERLFTGSFLTAEAILEGLGLVTIEKDSRISISKELIEEIKRTTIEDPKKAGPFYQSVREEIVKDFQIQS